MTTRVADAVLYTRAGPEIGVASTKAFTTQLACLYLVAVASGKASRHTVGQPRFERLLDDLTELPQKMEAILEGAKHIEDIAKDLFRAAATFSSSRAGFISRSRWKARSS